MEVHILKSIIIVSCGLFSIICAALDLDWFMENRKARFIVMLFKRNGARVFYIVLGLLVILSGFISYTA
ncbi:MAG: immunity 17 family protein [Clostridiales bacterium]|nr:immunity 17 family protein [Clostridiales bacterium]